MPLDVFLQHRFPDFGNVGIIGARGFFAEQGFELSGCQSFVSFFREENAIERERLRCRCVKSLGGRKEIHKRHPIGLCGLRHRRGVGLEIFVVSRAIGEVGRVLQVFMRDGGEQHDLWLSFAIIRCELLLQILIQRIFKVRQARLAFEGFIEAPIREDHVRMEIRARGVDDVGLSDLGRQRAGLHVEEVFGRRHLVTARMHIHFIRRKAEISHRQFVIRIGLVNQ